MGLWPARLTWEVFSFTLKSILHEHQHSRGVSHFLMDALMRF
jgi:hypothetical protein